MSSASFLEVSGWIGLSITSSTSLILLLKLVKKQLTCKYTTTLSTLHFLSTWICLEILAFFGAIKRCDQIPFQKRFILAFLVMTSIVSMNFNLAANSIGFYQMSKLCCVPYMLIWNSLVKHTKYTMGEIISLIILLFGVALFSVSDVEVNFVGTVYAAIAVVSTAHNQMITGELQKEYSLNGPELQLSIMPEEFSLGIICSTFLENIGENTFAMSLFSYNDIILILFTCFFAIGVNVATFGLIGKTSSVTYQVVGHAKTVLLLIFGYIFFPSQWESTFQMIRAMAGIVIALIGVFMYTKVRLDIAKKPKDPEMTPLIDKQLRA
ncbi:phosphate translocator protein [Tritrichomonas foetus]|uniref:Phosphate translocator protein n=1 Tax=Tritrichomonas foetus TaxID=1144522 RepID=A0A1J4KRF3_9EUKA|nr:phosphate translocator protein [Tritrichomonas foetus]|eukprot:OHT13512.1 phosphate translocator protein [Tritrichomonas foetus]